MRGKGRESIIGEREGSNLVKDNGGSGWQNVEWLDRDNARSNVREQQESVFSYFCVLTLPIFAYCKIYEIAFLPRHF